MNLRVEDLHKVEGIIPLDEQARQIVGETRRFAPPIQRSGVIALLKQLIRQTSDERVTSLEELQQDWKPTLVLHHISIPYTSELGLRTWRILSVPSQGDMVILRWVQGAGCIALVLDRYSYGTETFPEESMTNIASQWLKIHMGLTTTSNLLVV